KRADGTVLKEIRVWIVWCTVTPVLPIRKVTSLPLEPRDPRGLKLGVDWKFIHTINPLSIITDPDRPLLEGPKVSDVPAHDKFHVSNGQTLAGGANLKWDASRQTRVRMLDPDGIQTRSEAGQEQLDYPDNDAEGNDDTHTNDENNNPYEGRLPAPASK